jgi:hypothetical protein
MMPENRAGETKHVPCVITSRHAFALSTLTIANFLCIKHDC